MAQFLFNSESGATVSKSGVPLKMNYDNIASVVFSHPAIGAVGMTQGRDAFLKFVWGRGTCLRSSRQRPFASIQKSTGAK